MFKFAKGLVRHKIGVIAVIAFAFVMFSGGEEPAEVSSSPWSTQAPVQASAAKADDGSITATLGAVATSAGEYAAETFLGDKDLNPVKMGEETVGRFDSANEAFAEANKK